MPGIAPTRPPPKPKVTTPKPKPPAKATIAKVKAQVAAKTKAVKAALEKKKDQIEQVQAAADAAAATQGRRVDGRLNVGGFDVGGQRTAVGAIGPRGASGPIDRLAGAGVPRNVATAVVNDAARRGSIDIGARAARFADRFKPAALARSLTGVAETKNSALARGAGRVSTLAAGVAAIPQGASAIQAWRDVARNGPGGATKDKASRLDTAIKETAGTVSAVGNTAKGAVETRAMAKQYRTVRAVAKRQLARQPGATKAQVRRASRRAATKVVAGRSTRAVARTLRPVVGSGARRAAAPLAKTLVKVGARTAAKSAGRFVPGANVAIAVADVASAVQTVRDPNASNGKKVTSVITAVGSVAAATNIPVVSQVGAGISAVSSFVGGFF